MPVWDVPVRAFHWTLVIAVGSAWLTGGTAYGKIHEALGYLVLGLVGFRMIWGFVGTRHARFADFVRAPSVVLGYVSAVRAGTARRYLGHNPAGGAMILLLIGTLAAVGITGWLQLTLMFYGNPRLEAIHEWLAHAVLALVALHVAGVVVSSRLNGENLVAAMITGTKRHEAGKALAEAPESPEDRLRDRLRAVEALATLALLAAALAVIAPIMAAQQPPPAPMLEDIQDDAPPAPAKAAD